MGSGWSQQYTASWTPPLYPRMHLLPNGNIFSTPGRLTDDPHVSILSTKTWTTVANTKFGHYADLRFFSAVALTPANNYRPKVMILGGGMPSATATTEIIDLGASTPAWQLGPDMSQARVEMDAVLLPTGKVLAVGGSATDEDASTASLNADLYDPASQLVFLRRGRILFARLYHTVALLLPDATVWLAGSNPCAGVYEPHMEIYKPAYLFTRDVNNNVVAAPRPTISQRAREHQLERAVCGLYAGCGQYRIGGPDAAGLVYACV